MKVYVDLSAMLEFDTSRAIVDDEFIEQAVEEFAILAVPGLAEYLKEKAKVELIGSNVTNKEVIAE